MPPLHDKLLQTAVAAARRAQPILVSGYRRPLEVRYKSPKSPVTECDLASEKAIRETLTAGFPQSSVLGEEGGWVRGSSPVEWIVDPIDGTRNFAHGYPHFCISIAAQVEGRLAVAAVLDPIREELFTAVVGQGARLNNEPIQASRCDDFKQAMLATGFTTQAPPAQGPLFLQLQQAAESVRRTGSAVLDLCYVACGRLEAYWEWCLAPWDLAAGVLICQEAEATVTLLDGRPFQLEQGSVLASNTLLHKRMLDELSAT